ncbi:Structural polyprotein [Cleaved into: Capsid protein 1] [Parelaphostrongylus tenuis]|uniref:Structural polyprotein [Cleaved into: Capsid protein 1] n=1 Tax=Parelaphostrongylus tenuis TaxID=148309 RepID=A0AAD5R1V8_PARTN|nr:Structural polyprotein [Cleaved into: Capsid protein 1] [Parelaphostrongylus tenuis]
MSGWISDFLQRRQNFGKDSYTIENSVTAIQKEIMTYGPVTAAFIVYEDFLHYHRGIYKVM